MTRRFLVVRSLVRAAFWTLVALAEALERVPVAVEVTC